MDLSCHCGNVHIKVTQPPSSLTACNCSICFRFAALWGYYQPEEVTVTVKQTVSTYQWGDRCIDFYHCDTCGCATHYLTNNKVPDTKFGINFRMANRLDCEAIPKRHFDGADTWEFIDPPS
ncbi:aldehyde-activating protein [Shewanella sp. Scap07]|uniref:GFA family protein n=1 Tax=Shewanella sp. Scap07 TaxID=2589987 RepID=UPI0015B9C7EA|nr:aldehyde-activating protein [Shewanella sp. Scap07]QLE86977.1 aldehyde-activating protein [Shewanella sp. Scap07]